MRDRPAALLVAGLAFATTTAWAQDGSAGATAGRARASPDDVGNAMVVRRLSPQELRAAVERYNSKQCRTGGLRVRTDGSRFWIGGAVFSFDALADELVRRYDAHRFHCVDIMGPGYDPRRVSTLLGRVRASTGIDKIDWAPGTTK